MNTPSLGDKVKEIVTGSEGIITGLCSYLWGCEQALVAHDDKDGKPESTWWDFGRLEVLETDVLKPVAYAAYSTPHNGPDKPAPVR